MEKTCVSRCLEASAKGAAGGLCGAFAGYVAVVLAHRWTGDANIWLKGPHGPGFFDLVFSTLWFYACLGAFLSKGLSSGMSARLRTRLAAAAASAAAVFLVFALPMILATYLFAWGEDPSEPATWRWFYLVLGAYSAGNLAAAGVSGYLAQQPRSWGAGLGAAAGAVLAYLLQYASRLVFPGWDLAVEVVGGWLPPPSALSSGALWGALIGGGAAFFVMIASLRKES